MISFLFWLMNWDNFIWTNFNIFFSLTDVDSLQTWWGSSSSRISTTGRIGWTNWIHATHSIATCGHTVATVRGHTVPSIHRHSITCILLCLTTTNKNSPRASLTTLTTTGSIRASLYVDLSRTCGHITAASTSAARLLAHCLHPFSILITFGRTSWSIVSPKTAIRMLILTTSHGCRRRCRRIGRSFLSHSRLGCWFRRGWRSDGCGWGWLDSCSGDCRCVTTAADGILTFGS